jgi:pimeloyl-ACP methyl ester carboxylesterase
MFNEKTFDAGELVLRYYEGTTDAPPMVLLHGLTGQGLFMIEPFSALQPDWHIYAPDLRGHGASGRAADNHYDIGAYSRDIIPFLKQIGEPAVVIGHSLGALTTIGVASGYPEGVRAAVLLDPPLYSASEPIDIDPDVKQYFQWVYDLKSSSPSDEEILAQSRQMMKGADEDEVKESAETLAGVAPGTVQAVLENRLWGDLDLAECLQKIQAPTLMIHGDWDTGGATREDDVAFFKANLPTATIVRIPGANHSIPREHGDVVVRELNKLLSSI